MLTLSRLKELLAYTPATGSFTWLVVNQRHFVGGMAGSLNGNGYPTIIIDGRGYSAHRLAFLMVTGSWPKGQVDHLNGVRSDNRWVNLRDVSRAMNQQNRRKPSRNNKSGFLGVTWSKSADAWCATISVAGKNRILGYFHSPEEASGVYLTAKRFHHPGCTL